MTTQLSAKLPMEKLIKFASLFTNALDEWLIVQQAVTVEHGRMVIKHLIDHDELQERAASFMETTLLRSKSESLKFLSMLDVQENSSLVPQLQQTLRQWQDQQQQPSTDEDEM